VKHFIPQLVSGQAKTWNTWGKVLHVGGFSAGVIAATSPDTRSSILRLVSQIELEHKGSLVQSRSPVILKGNGVLVGFDIVYISILEVISRQFVK